MIKMAVIKNVNGLVRSRENANVLRTIMIVYSIWGYCTLSKHMALVYFRLLIVTVSVHKC